MGFKQVTVVGLGYIGLPTATMIASKGVDVYGLEINQQIVNTINAGKIHIVEPDLQPLVKECVESGKLKAGSKPIESDVFIIAVPTPFKSATDKPHQPDLSFVKNAVRMIAPVIKAGDLIILESTSPVGTTESISKLITEIRTDLTVSKDSALESDIFVAYCPERVLPGKILHELVENDRIVGGISKDAGKLASKLYKLFLTGTCHETDARTAEMVKLTENASRDVQIAFANELSLICNELNIDVWELIDLSNKHPRVNILNPGPGVGGHCIAVDPWFIVSSSPENSRLIQTARAINDYKPSWVLSQAKTEIKKIAGNFNRIVKVACYGVTFKANIDDLRESPALDIAMGLAEVANAQVTVVEPNIPDLKLKNIKVTNCVTDVEDADLHLLLVDHDEFKHFRPGCGAIIDTRGIWGKIPT